MKRNLSRIFHKLIVEGGISSKDIVVLTPKSSTSEFKEREKFGNFELYSTESKSNNAIRKTTIQKFRGMERKVVIITEMDEGVEEFDVLYYMGSSRAKTLLVLLLCDDIDQKKKEKLIENSDAMF